MNTTYIVTLHGQPVTRITEEPNGEPNVTTGKQENAIEYTEAEAAQVAAWIGLGAEIENTTNEWNTARTGNHQGLIVDAHGKNIAVAYDKAHAPLIAAAPELLAALDDCATAIDAIMPRASAEEAAALRSINARARAAIVKARGE